MSNTDPQPTASGHASGAQPKQLSLATRAIHSDDHISAHRAIAPAMHVSTTFEYSRNPDDLKHWDNTDPSAPLDSHIYSRATAPNTTRLEAILSSALNGPSVTYASGLAAFHALLAFDLPLDPHADSEVWAQLRPGDVIHVETPLNPTGEALDLVAYAERARAAGAYLTVDATFAPPPLQDPLALGADVVLHSGTKYFGGHSDMLCGVLTVNPARAAATAATAASAAGKAPEEKEDMATLLRFDRIFLGSVMGSLEGCLGLRSLRTLELRVLLQSRSAEQLVAWLDAEARRDGSPASRLVLRVSHASLQPEARDPDSWLRKQMPGGFGPVFAFYMKDKRHARRLPSKLGLFHHATSLGGVESIIEWRRVSDGGCDERLMRVSIGVEGWEDLRDDLVEGFAALIKEDETPLDDLTGSLVI
ncbi:cystathionine gamma-synthase [Verticillium alfalfae VaMs.102]|uniref:Cystathionine gamma-synthase n=1 Tax=Verticillium alfalfae (strain VaMs.102 / ATCC MYA-4576 / FGSC 10136) TaxID=526221 RepID=C9SMF6_VERA1|nr:cystathionine gamma-synthase [Verticillium alfalfae VaMs.102]EEY19971.1 cystathionine gamma-synthase [Verticillium alfalfae VaMs.102]